MSTPTKRPLLFISHASEDKADFVAPLAKRLQQSFDVWYDDFTLRLGDSLLQRIDEGLAKCDFAVVVLSKAFFAKEWTNKELSGLVGLENRTRKVILPVWKDVTAEQVRSFSPILADKVAVRASEGLDKVVEEIQLAVQVSARQTELVSNSVQLPIRQLAQQLAERKEAERMAYSEEGAKLVSEGYDDLCQQIRSALEGASNDVLKFTFGQPMRYITYIGTIRGMHLALSLRELASNSAAGSMLDTKIFQRHFGAFGEPHGDGVILDEKSFKPTFRAGALMWIDADDDAKLLLSTTDLAQRLVQQFVEEITEQLDS